MTITISRDPRDWAKSARFCAEHAFAQKPATSGMPKVPVTYERDRPGIDLAAKTTRFNPRFGVFEHAPSAPLPEALPPRHTYTMRSDAHGPYHTVFHKTRDIPIPVATLRGDKAWVDHEVMRYARSLRSTSKSFLVTPCIAPNSRGDWCAAAGHVSRPYVSP